ncbi:cathepsin F-like isoform X3 [Rhodnius prolixus]|uniref:cathepsin F-like isoform X3 n=1 Tax=Rhodnius prolixus TaxID=13249 RepID=UPI003D18A651
MRSITFLRFQLIAVLFMFNSYADAKNCVGCPVDADVNSPEIKKHLEKVLVAQNEDCDIVKVISAQTQIISGVRYKVYFEVKDRRTNQLKFCSTSFVSQVWISPEPQMEYFNCKLQGRDNRQLLATLKEVEANEKELVTQLADLAVKTLDDIDTDNYKRVVAEVLDAKKQLVNGIMYHLKLRVKITSCSEDRKVSADCEQEESHSQEICKVQIHRSFADSSPLNAKVVSSECDHNILLGEPKEASVESEEIKAAANFAAERIDQMSNSIYKQILVRILEATSQVAAGIKMDLKLELGNTECMKNMDKKANCEVVSENAEKMICRVSVWSQPWKQSSGKSHLKLSKFYCGPFYRTKRSLVGGESSLDTNDKRVTDLTDYVEDELTNRSNSQYTKTIVKVLNATVQVVSGKLTRLTVEVTDTNCLKSENKLKSLCSASNQGQQLCTVAIWERPWLNQKEITQSECHSTQNMTAEILGLDGTKEEVKSFINFMQREDKDYKSPAETARRFRIFRANMKKAAFLQKHEQGTATYGASMFADLTTEEFKKYLGFKVNPEQSIHRKMAIIPNITLPKEFDWRNYNVVTTVKNQGMCGSCWAFSVTGNIEGLWALQNKELLSLSEQELVDCDTFDKGCLGGDFDTAYRAIEFIGGLETETDYPYKGWSDRCHFNKSEIKVSISGAYNVSHDEEDIAKYLVANGPISVAVNANAMQFYMGGVSHPLKFLCSPNNLDHAVLIVGYGVHRTRFTHKNLPYWLIKNSWGTRWGNKGYYMLYKGDGSCGVNQMPTTAVL